MLVPIIVVTLAIILYQSRTQGKKPSTPIMVAVLVIAALFFAVLLWPS
jgi:putative effector of murein hydrolase